MAKYVTAGGAAIGPVSPPTGLVLYCLLLFTLQAAAVKLGRVELEIFSFWIFLNISGLFYLFAYTRKYYG